MESINFTWNNERKRYEKALTATSSFQIRIKNPDAKGASILEVYSLNSDGEVPVLITRAGSQNNIIDKTIELDGYPRNIILSLVYEPSLAEMQFNSPTGSGTISETIQNTVKNIAGTDPGSSTALSPEIDSVKEMTDFLDGYSNEQKLSDVLEEATGLADETDIDNLFN